MSLGNKFYVNRKGGTRGGRWVYLKGANSMAVSGLGFRKALGGPSPCRDGYCSLDGRLLPESTD